MTRVQFKQLSSSCMDLTMTAVAASIAVLLQCFSTSRCTRLETYTVYQSSNIAPRRSSRISSGLAGRQTTFIPLLRRCIQVQVVIRSPHTGALIATSSGNLGSLGRRTITIVLFVHTRWGIGANTLFESEVLCLDIYLFFFNLECHG